MSHSTAGNEWVPFYRSLTLDDRRSMTRSARFIYLEICLEARELGGRVILPSGFRSDADAVRDIIGGDRGEIRRALAVLTREPAPLLHLEDSRGARVVHSVNFRARPSTPSTARVHRYRAKWGTRNLSKATRAAVIKRDGFVCGICGCSVAPDDVHIDHRIPFVRGGTDDLSNLRVTHSTCNRRKGAR